MFAAILFVQLIAATMACARTTSAFVRTVGKDLHAENRNVQMTVLVMALARSPWQTHQVSVIANMAFQAQIVVMLVCT